MFRTRQPDDHMRFIRIGMPFGIIGTAGVFAGRIIGSPKLEVISYVPVAIWGATLFAFLAFELLGRRRTR